jgi:hypothetical protein
MFTKRTTVAIFVILTALALITAGSYTSSAVVSGYHKKKIIMTSNSVSNNDLKSLFACQSKAAKNGPVTQAEVDNCYNQIFPQGQGGQTQPSSVQQTASVQQPSSMQGGQTPPQQTASVQQPSSMQGGQTPPQQTASVQQLVQLMREGFPFK